MCSHVRLKIPCFRLKAKRQSNNFRNQNAMKCAILFVSVHHHNTAKISEAMGDAIGAELLSIAEAKERATENWDLLGIGSGIFFASHHKSLLRFCSHWTNRPKAAFLFSTAGLPSLGWFWHRSLRAILKRQQIPILAEACFPGWDTVGPLQWIGGIQQGRPNPSDLDRAARFARSALVQATQRPHPES